MGLISLTATGVGKGTNITGVASLASKAGFKCRVDATGLQSLASGATGVKLACWSCDSDGAGTNVKWEVYYENDASHNIRVVLSAPNNGPELVQTSFIAAASWPSAGNFVEIYTGWDNTQPKQQIVAYDANGTVVNDGVHSANAVNTTASGPLNTTGGANGIISLNRGVAGVTRAGIYDGLWMYSGLLVGNNQYLPGRTGDANVVDGWTLDDVGSPAFATSSVTANHMTFTVGQFSWLAGGAWDPVSTVPFRQPTMGMRQAVVRGAWW